MDASFSGKAVKAGSNCHELERGHGYQAMGGRMVCGDCGAAMPSRVEAVAAESLTVVRQPVYAVRTCAACDRAFAQSRGETEQVVCGREKCQTAFRVATQRLARLWRLEMAEQPDVVDYVRGVA